MYLFIIYIDIKKVYADLIFFLVNKHLRMLSWIYIVDEKTDRERESDLN